MAKYCQPDRTPCDALTAQLGRSIFVDQDSGQFVILTTDPNCSAPTPVPINYCLFCGCNLEQIPMQPGQEVKAKKTKKKKRS